MSAIARTQEHNNRTIPMRAEQMTPRHRLLVEYMLYGLPHPTLCERTQVVDRHDEETGLPIMRNPQVGEPLELEQAAQVLGMKLRHARGLQKQQPFARLMAAETAAMRSGAAPRAMRRMIKLVDEPGQGKAADRKVQLAAAQAVLGEHGSTVNVNVDARTQIAMQPGVVIRLPAAAPVTKLDNQDHDQ